jgi:hypothetical protein
VPLLLLLLLLLLHRWGLSPVLSTAGKWPLCSYATKAAKGTIYGAWGPAADSETVDACFEALENGTRTTNSREGTSTYNCGCCCSLQPGKGKLLW